mgnify:CR=1 FL=1
MTFAIDNVIDRWFDGITAAQVAEALAGIKDGETLELSINSPGGDVYEGIAIFNAIREVAKTHPVIVTINGLAASMASYIALAARTVNGNAVVKVSDNSIFMIHNPYTIASGDYKRFEKTAGYLKQLAGVLAGVYQSVSKKNETDIRALMDETTFFVGNEIYENGFANEFEKLAAPEQDDTTDAPLIESRDSLIVNAKLKIKNCYDQLEKAAALLQAPAVSGKGVAAHNDTNTNGGSMNVEELKAKDTACYDAVFALGEKAGREKQSALVSGHLRLAAKCGAYELAAKFIEEGKPVAEESVQDAYMDFAMAKAQTQNRIDDNPPATHTESAENNADEKALMAEFDKGFFGKE